VFHDVTTSGKSDDHCSQDDEPLYLNLFILLASLGGALLALRLTGGLISLSTAQRLLCR